MSASSLAAKLGGGTGMYSQGSLDDVQPEVPAPEAPKPEFRHGGAKAPGATLMSEANKTLLRTMISEREGKEGVDAVQARLNQAREGGYLTKVIFRECFEALKAIPQNGTGVKRGEAAPVWFVKRNQYAGDCNQCERRVAAEAGFVAMGDEGKWVVWHEVCPSDFPFPEGRYAVDNEDGELRFYHLVNGEVFVMASDTEFPIHGNAAEAIVAKIAVDPEAASRRYGQEIGECGVCGRTLTNEDSRAAGIGPICAGKAFV